MNWLLGVTGIDALIDYISKSNSSQDEDDSEKPEALSAKATDLGTPIPVVLGTFIVKNPLTVFWGDFDSRPYTETYGASTDASADDARWWVAALVIIAIGACIGSSTGAMIGALIALLLFLFSLFDSGEIKTTIQKGFFYFLGYQQIICWTHKNARLKKVYMENNLVWEGDEPASNHLDGSPLVINISDPNLFGGPDENGGFVGNINIYFGGDNQMPDPWMVRQMNATSVQPDLRGKTPAYRMFISAVVPQSYIGKRATIPKMWYEIEIISDSLNESAHNYGIDKIAEETGLTVPDVESYVNISNRIDSDINPMEAMNEIVTNKNWGLNGQLSHADMVSILIASYTLNVEKLGVSFALTSVEKARDIIDRICEHVNAVHYLDPSSGKIVYRLIRGDYLANVNAIKKITQSNCSNIKFVREDWSTTVSSIYVTFTSRDAIYETGTVSTDDIANIEIQNGSTTTKSYSRPYFTNANNALWAAKTLLKVSAFPLSCITADMNRTMYDIRLGDVIMVDFPSFGISKEIMRVTSFTDSDYVNGGIHLEAIEDVFALEKSDFNYKDIIEWEPDPIFPTGAQYFMFMEMPFEVVHTFYTYVYAYCCRPSLNEVTWNIWRENATTSFYISSTMSTWSATGYIVYDYNEDTDSIDVQGIEVHDMYGIDDYKAYMVKRNLSMSGHPRNGAYLMVIGDEIMSFGSLDRLSNGNWKIGMIIRGTYDTVPANHKSTDKVFLIKQGGWTNVAPNGYICGIGDIVTERYNITTSTVTEDETFDNSKITTLTTTRRTERPSVQGRVRINAHMLNDVAYPKEVVGNIHMTWEDRNKFIYSGCFSQDDIGDYISKTPIIVPTDLKYNTEIYIDGNFVRAQTNSTDRYFDYNWTERVNDNPNLTFDTKIVTYSVLNGLESHQRQSRIFKWNIPLCVGVANNAIDAQRLIASLDSFGTVYIPNGAHSQYKSIEYGEGILVLIGSVGIGNIYDYAGASYKCNGDAVVFYDKNTYTTISLPVDFVIECVTYDVLPVMNSCRKWNGTTFEMYNKTGVLAT